VTRAASSPLPLLPGPAARLLTGTTLDALAGQLHAAGRALRVTIAGADHLVSADPDIARHVLVGNADNYVKDIRLMAPFLGLLGDGLLTSEGPLWRRQRALLAQAFRADALRVVASATRRAVDRAGERLDEHAQRGSIVDLGAEIRRLTLQVIAGATLSLTADESDELLLPLYEPIVAEANRRVWLPLRGALPIPGRARHDDALAALERLLHARIDARRRRGPADPVRSDDMLDLLLAGSGPWTAETAALVRDELKTMIFAGHETTSAALTWTLHALMRHPDCFARLRAAAADAFADDASEFAALRRLDYAGACLKEALRLYNVVPIVVRRAVADDRLGDDLVPAGGLVLLHLQALHRDPRYWPEPDAFRPERFHGSDGPPSPCLPFLVGPRSCLGQHFALLEAKLVLALLARRFEFTPDPGNRDDRHRFNIPVGPAGTIAARVARRA
jgi:cytochrome P450